MNLPPALDRTLRMVVFDWDGTAVVDRREDAAPLRWPVERLLRLGVIVVVVTGTSLEKVHGQLSAGIRGPHKKNLFIATNRGSEVHAFDARGAPTRLWVREATIAEEAALTRSAEALRDAIRARGGLDVGVVYDRMNRRKVDLIPLDAWRDPPKSAIGDLLVAVEARLRGAGIGGLREVVELARRLSNEQGLADARITSDVKHVEIGLTDKGDSLAWVLETLARPRGIEPREILIGGDEMGPIGGVAGSDSRMMLPAAHAALFLSVGVEPEGVPPGVVHLPGGPQVFRAVLGAIAARYPVTLPAEPTSDDAWRIVEEGFVVAREHEIEALFASSNGLVGSRASLAEGSALSSPATFVAGVYGSQPGAIPGLVPIGDWAHISATIAGHPLRLDAGEIVEHRRILDLFQAMTWREWTHRDPAGRVTRIRGFRLASRAEPHLVFQSMTLCPENYTATVAVDATMTHPSVVHVSAEQALGLAHAGELETPEGVRMVLSPGGSQEATSVFDLPVEIGRTYRADRLLAVCPSRDAVDPEQAARGFAERAIDLGIAAMIDQHRRAWRELWRAADVEIEGDPHAQRALRFALYHLLSAGSPSDERVSIGARGLTGAAYAGHVFWDTEIYMMPFFTLVWPAAARALLMYRFHTLPGARAKAARLGYRGAFYAWESADTGDEAAPQFVIGPDGVLLRIHVGEQEQHISADVAYAVHRYWRATGDDRFLLEAGAEIVLETARFWASRAELGADGLYHIRGVIGPDEYHESVDDDAYTNTMASWNLETASEIVTLLAARWPERWRELSSRCSSSAEEGRAWATIAARMYTGLDPRTGVIEQFRGYHALEEVDLRSFEPRTAPMDVLLGRERTRRSKVIKQPDVLMLIHLLWDRFAPEVRAANFDYYDPRTGHGSSLSPSIHALLAARLGRLELAGRYFRQAAEIDLADNLGNAAAGVHAAALGGLWQAVITGFAGLRMTAEGPTVSPALPPDWRRLSFSIQWRGKTIRYDLPQPAREASPPPRQEVIR